MNCRIHLHFQRSIHSVNWDKKQAVFKAADGTAETFPYDLLIASDGRHSKCRQLYQQHDPCFTSFLQPNSRDYAAFSGNTMPGGALHAFTPSSLVSGCPWPSFPCAGRAIHQSNGHSRQLSLCLADPGQHKRPQMCTSVRLLTQLGVQRTWPRMWC